MTLRVMVVTGTRAEFGLLERTIDAIREHDGLELVLVAAGAHLIGDRPTIGDVRARFPVDAEIVLQIDGAIGRAADAAALGRGVAGFAETIERVRPDWLLVLGDRIEAFAAASAASVGGVAVAHIHGGDRAEGVADDAMRHAITKLSHLHLAATEASAARLERLGERSDAIHVVGSPAVDGVDASAPLSDDRYRDLGSPRAVLLHHGSGLEPHVEDRWIAAAIEGLRGRGPVLAIRPNSDPGSDRVDAALAASDGLSIHPGLVREDFLGLLRRVEVLVGNSSAGLIEAAIVGCPAVNLGPRQSGRERCANVFDVANPDPDEIADAIRRAVEVERRVDHPYGAPGVALRIATLLVEARGGIDLRKRITY